VYWIGGQYAEPGLGSVGGFLDTWPVVVGNTNQTFGGTVSISCDHTTLLAHIRTSSLTTSVICIRDLGSSISLPPNDMYTSQVYHGYTSLHIYQPYWASKSIRDGRLLKSLQCVSGVDVLRVKTGIENM
jgi:hypothetical protein